MYLMINNPKNKVTIAKNKLVQKIKNNNNNLIANPIKDKNKQKK